MNPHFDLKTVSKYFLIAVNALFLVFGIALIITGIVIRVDSALTSLDLSPMLEELSFHGIGLGFALQAFSVTIAIFGVMIAVLSGIGLAAAYFEIACLLIIYALIVIALIVGEFIVIVLWSLLINTVQDFVKTELMNLLENFYESDDLSVIYALSTAWNYAFMLLKCCGVNSVEGTTNDFDDTVWQSSKPGYEIPKFCCGATTETYKSFSNKACTHSVTSGYYSVGCYDMINDYVEKYSNVFIGVGITTIFIEIAAVVAACFNVCRKDVQSHDLQPGVIAVNPEQTVN